VIKQEAKLSPASRPYCITSDYVIITDCCQIASPAVSPVITIRYDIIQEFNVDWKAECDQLNLAHETKTNKRQCPLSSVHVQDPWRQSGRNEKIIIGP